MKTKPESKIKKKFKIKSPAPAPLNLTPNPNLSHSVPDETAEYCQEAGPFHVVETFPAQHKILAANGEAVCACGDADVAYYVAEALNRQRKSELTPARRSGTSAKDE